MNCSYHDVDVVVDDDGGSNDEGGQHFLSFHPFFFYFSGKINPTKDLQKVFHVSVHCRQIWDDQKGMQLRTQKKRATEMHRNNIQSLKTKTKVFKHPSVRNGFGLRVLYVFTSAIIHYYESHISVLFSVLCFSP